MSRKPCPVADYVARVKTLAQIGAWSLDAATSELWWSDHTYRIHELPVGAPVTFEDAIAFYAASSQQAARDAAHATIAEGRPFDLELEFTTATGRHLWVRVAGERVVDQGRTFLLGMLQDVTMARQHRLAAEANAAFLESIIFHIPHMVFVKEASELRFIRFNRAGERLLGVSNAALIGKSDSDFFPPEQAAFFLEKDREALMAEHCTEIHEEPIDTPTGQRFLHTLKIPIRAADGRPEYLLGISEDITEKKFQAELIARQQQALVTASRLSALGQMAGGIAHEINNPLAIIAALASRVKLLADADKLTALEAAETAQRIQNVVLRISGIVSSLRNIARDTGRDPFETTTIKQILADTMELCRERLRYGGVEVRIRDYPEEWSLRCRPTQIGQVLLNLLNNAFDAIAASPTKWIEVAVEQRDERVRLIVTDSGPGIDPALREKIMLPFFTTKDVGKGTGLGLSISQSLVEEHKGRLLLDPLSAQTCFIIDLPADPEAAAVAA